MGHLTLATFGDSIARLHRADERFGTLEAEFVALPVEAKAVRLGQKFDPEHDRISVFIAEVPRYPAGWSMLISESLFHMRAALDHFAWQLALWHLEQQGKATQPNKRTQYPIAESADAFDKISYMYRDLHPAHVALIKKLQPYGDEFVMAEREKYPHAPLRGIVASHPLTILRSLSDHDKHRTLSVIAASGGYVGFEVLGYVDCSPGQQSWNNLVTEFDKGTEWRAYRVIPTGPDPKVVMNERILPRLSIGGGHEPLRLLPNISGAIGYVLTRFAESPNPN